MKDKQENIQQILNELREDSEKGTPIIVEGRKDLEALHCFGINGIILTLKTGGKSFMQFLQEIEQIKAKEVILMLDFDRRGKEATALLKQRLEHSGIKPNLKFWHKLSAFVGRDVQCVEGITSYLRTLEMKSM